jgi:hypothetical protein
MRAAREFDPAATTAARQPHMADLAWSAEPPEYVSPLPVERRRPWFMPSGVLTFVGGGLVAATTVGLFGALHVPDSAPFDVTNHTPPPAVPAAAPAYPGPTPGNQPMPATTSNSVAAIRRPSRPSAHERSALAIQSRRHFNAPDVEPSRLLLLVHASARPRRQPLDTRPRQRLDHLPVAATTMFAAVLVALAVTIGCDCAHRTRGQESARNQPGLIGQRCLADIQLLRIVLS